MGKNFVIETDELESFDNEQDFYDTETQFYDMQTGGVDAIDFEIHNTDAATDVYIQLFNPLNSILKTQDLRYRTGGMLAAGYEMIPAQSFKGVQQIALSVGTDLSRTVVPPSGVVTTDEEGSLIIFGNQGASANNKVKVKVTGANSNYQKVLDRCIRGAISVTGWRFVFQSEAQLNEQLILDKTTTAGGSAGNTISPNQFFTPNQFQTLRVDVPVPVVFNPDAGLFYKVRANERVLLTVFCKV